jgi:mRNA interferase MazF
MHIKDFQGWHKHKQEIHKSSHLPTFNEREIWWCSTGINVGVEQDGKNMLYERPVLIVRKFNRRLFWGVPITTRLKEFPFHHPIHYQGENDTARKERRAVLSQMRAYDSVRLTRPMAKLGHQQFDEIIRLLTGILKRSK